MINRAFGAEKSVSSQKKEQVGCCQHCSNFSDFFECGCVRARVRKFTFFNFNSFFCFASLRHKITYFFKGTIAKKFVFFGQSYCLLCCSFFLSHFFSFTFILLLLLKLVAYFLICLFACECMPHKMLCECIWLQFKFEWQARNVCMM